MATQKELLSLVGRKRKFVWTISCISPRNGKRFRQRMECSGELMAFKATSCHLRNDHYDFLVCPSGGGVNLLISWRDIKTVEVTEEKQ